MKCSDYDLKGFFLEELTAGDRRAVKDHLHGCDACRAELDRLRTTHTALLTLREQEMPRRIAFVSDKVIAPSWWRRFWQSGPRLGFAAAAMLSLAIIVNAFARPAPVVQPEVSAALEQRVKTLEANFDQRLQKEVEARVRTAVEAKLAEREAQYQAKLASQISTSEKRLQARHQQELRAVENAYEMLRKQNNINYILNASYRGM